ncbi:MAG: hypothetical protein K0U39_08550 [Alphaproteobacteria bacterium]|nr:hypothetical protein [Alphaproteobacteria bacterium]
MSQQYIFSFPTQEKLTRDNFIIADCNRDAFDILQKYPDWPAPFLAIYGAPKSGKSHLIKAWMQDKNIAQHIHQCRFSELAMLDDDLPNHTLLWLDDDINDNHSRTDNALTKEAEEILFHLYNRIMLKQQRGLIITSVTPPAKWRINLPDLASRLKSMPNVALGMPSDDLLAQLFHKLCRDRQIKLDDKIIDYLLVRMERSFFACYNLCDQLNQHSLSRKGKITLNIAKQCLLDDNV